MAERGSGVGSEEMRCGGRKERMGERVVMVLDMQVECEMGNASSNMYDSLSSWSR